MGASRVIEIGCADIDAAIAQLCNVDAYTAADYREQNHEGVLDSAECAAVYERLSLEIRKAVNFYLYENRESELSDVYYCGMGADIPQFITVAEQDAALQLSDIEKMLPKDFFPGSEGVHLHCVYAVGAALPQDSVRLS
jgi:type IV pilus assembly protein PilM